MRCASCFFSDHPVSDEVCRRCTRNTTRAEIVDLALMGVMYVLLCRFSYYLFTGDFVAHFWRGGFSFPVVWSDVFVRPVNLSEHPWHLFALAWTFALIIAVPSLVAMFYRPKPGILFALVGGYFVPAPFFLVPLVASAVMAGTRARNALSIRASLAAAVLFPSLYLLALTLGAGLWTVGAWAFLPWVLAALLAGALMAGAFLAARARDYNARFLVWTFLAQWVVIFVVFYSSVGFSKVDYEFLRQEYAASSARFRFLVRAPNARETGESERAAAAGEFERRRLESLNAFSRLISWFPREAETPLALFERAELSNARPGFANTTPDQVFAYTDRITDNALRDYRRIRADFPGSLVSVEARLHAARYYLQHAEFDNGVRELRELIDYCYVHIPLDYRPPGGASVLGRWRSHRLTNAEDNQLLYEVLQESRGEIRFLERNSDCQRLPLEYYEQIDLHDPGATAELQKVLRTFPDCRLAGTIKLAILEREGWSVDSMKGLLAQYPKSDAVPRMLLLLGSRCLERGDPASAEGYLRRLTTEFPESPEAARGAMVLSHPVFQRKKD